jgi:hypothetical protein
VRRSASLALLVTVVSLANVAHSDEGICREAISAEAAQHVFDRLQARGADGCALSDLRTEQTRIKVRWSKVGQPMPEATIEPVGCASGPTVAGDTLALSSPPELSAGCPDAFSAMTDAVRSLRPPTAPLASWPYATSRPFAVASWIGVALALIGTMVAVVTALRRGGPET